MIEISKIKRALVRALFFIVPPLLFTGTGCQSAHERPGRLVPPPTCPVPLCRRFSPYTRFPPAIVAAEQLSSRCPLATHPVPRLQHTHCSLPAQSSTPNPPAHCRPVKPRTQPARCPPPARSSTPNPPVYRHPVKSCANPSAARRHSAGPPH